MNLSPAQIQNFWGSVRKAGPDDCWPWRTGRTAIFGWHDPDGVFRQEPPSRVAYTLAIGPIPLGFHVKHRCRVGWCCNPAHLYLEEPLERTVNAYVLTDGPQVVGVRSTLPAAIRLANHLDDDDSAEGHRRVAWTVWEEVQLNAADDYAERRWVRRSLPSDEVGYEQRIELHVTGTV